MKVINNTIHQKVINFERFSAKLIFTRDIQIKHMNMKLDGSLSFIHFHTNVLNVKSKLYTN